MSEAKVLTNAVLKLIMTDTLLGRGFCTDVDAVTQSGIYEVQPTTLNLPSGAYGYGVLIVARLSVSCWVKVYFPHHQDAFIRVCWSSVGVWRKLTTTAVT